MGPRGVYSPRRGRNPQDKRSNSISFFWFLMAPPHDGTIGEANFSSGRQKSQSFWRLCINEPVFCRPSHGTLRSVSPNHRSPFTQTRKRGSHPVVRKQKRSTSLSSASANGDDPSQYEAKHDLVLESKISYSKETDRRASHGSESALELNENFESIRCVAVLLLCANCDFLVPWSSRKARVVFLLAYGVFSTKPKRVFFAGGRRKSEYEFMRGKCRNRSRVQHGHVSAVFIVLHTTRFVPVKTVHHCDI